MIKTKSSDCVNLIHVGNYLEIKKLPNEEKIIQISHSSAWTNSPFNSCWKPKSLCQRLKNIANGLTMNMSAMAQPPSLCLQNPYAEYDKITLVSDQLQYSYQRRFLHCL